MNYLFGPIDSRRLGRSLGIDLLPFKTCSLDCVYCECGATTNHTTERREWVPTAEVLAELDAFLATGPVLDWVTFSGSGEPTLHDGIGTIIRHLKKKYPQYKVAVLTNGTLLGDPAVADALAPADLVSPSLDSATLAGFQKICRPVSGLDLPKVVEGIARFRSGFRGTLLLEVFVVPGINDTPEEVGALRQALLTIQPDAVQLNRLDRAGTEPSVGFASDQTLATITKELAPLVVQAVRVRRVGEALSALPPGTDELVLSILQKGPVTLERLSLMSGVREGDLAKLLQRLKRDKKIVDNELNVWESSTSTISRG